MTSPSQEEPANLDNIHPKKSVRKDNPLVTVPNELSDIEADIERLATRLNESMAESQYQSDDEPSAIGDELKHKLQQRADQWEASPVTKGYLREVWPLIEAYVEEQTKLARIDELNAIQAAHDVNQYDCSVLKKVVADRMADLEASIRERSEGEQARRTTS